MLNYLNELGKLSEGSGSRSLWARILRRERNVKERKGGETAGSVS